MAYTSGQSTATLVQELYIAYFGRPADVAGSNNATALINWNGTPSSLLVDFGKSAEYTSQFTGLTAAQTVDKIYQNLFGRSAESAGLNFWATKIASGEITLANAVWTILNGVTAGSVDDTAVSSKVTWATAFTSALASDAAANVAYNASTLDSVKAQLLTIKDAATLATANTGLTAFVTTMTTNGAGVAGQTFTLTNGLDAKVGTAGNDTFVGTLDLVATSQTINVGDSVDGGAGIDTFKLSSNVLAASNNNSGLTLTNVEKVEIANLVAGAANLHTFDATKAVGVQEVAATSIGNVTVTNIGTAALGARGFVSNNGAAQALTAAGANTLNLGGVSVGTTAGSALNVDISGGSAAAAQAVVVNSTGAANTITDLKIGNLVVGASSLTVNAATNFKTTTVTELIGNSLKTITVSGAATTVDLGTIASNALVSVDATGLTAGGIKVGVGANTATTVKGGAGNDTVTIAAAAVMTGTVDGGAGTDTLALSTAASLPNATVGKLFTNFETLQVSNAGAAISTETYDPTFLSGITSYKVAASTGAVALTNLAAAPTVTVTGDVAGTAGLALTLKDATGAADVVNITLDNGKTDSTIVNNGVTVSKLTAANVETINIHSNGLVTGAGATANTITANDVASNLTLSKVVVDGSQAFSFATGNNAIVLTVDASTATGNGTINATGATKLVNINGGLGNDTITAGGAGGLVAGGKGGDAVALGAGTDTLVYKAASDSVQDFTGVAGVAGKGTMDAVTAFTSGTDKIDLTSLNFTTATTKVFVDKTFADTTALQTAEAAATFFQDATNITRGAVVAHVGADSYLVVDADHNGTFSAAGDLVVKLTATAALVQTDVIWG